MLSRMCTICSKKSSLQHDGVDYCLLHYSTSAASPNFSTHTPVLLNEVCLKNEEDAMRSLWSDAISSVVLRMYQLQKLEEDQIRQDPLAMLSVKAPALPLPVPRKTNYPVKRRISTTLRHDELDPYSKKTRREKTLLRGEKIQNSNETEADSSIILDKGDSSSSTGDHQCEHCHSFNTKVHHSSGQCDSSRSETWGSKSGPNEIAHIDCLDCNLSYSKCL